MGVNWDFNDYVTPKSTPGENNLTGKDVPKNSVHVSLSDITLLQEIKA